MSLRAAPNQKKFIWNAFPRFVSVSKCLDQAPMKLKDNRDLGTTHWLMTPKYHFWPVDGETDQDNKDSMRKSFVLV